MQLLHLSMEVFDHDKVSLSTQADATEIIQAMNRAYNTQPLNNCKHLQEKHISNECTRVIKWCSKVYSTTLIKIQYVLQALIKYFRLFHMQTGLKVLQYTYGTIILTLYMVGFQIKDLLVHIFVSKTIVNTEHWQLQV